MPKLWRFSIQDPFDHTHDLGTVLSEQSWRAIQVALRQTAKALQMSGDIAALVLANPPQVYGADAADGAGAVDAPAAAVASKASKASKAASKVSTASKSSKAAKQQQKKLNRKQKRAEARLARAEATLGVRPEAQLPDLRTTLAVEPATRGGSKLPDLRTTIAGGAAASGATPLRVTDRKVLLKRLKGDKKRLARCKKLQAKPLEDLSAPERKIVASFAKLERKVKARSAEIDALQ